MRISETECPSNICLSKFKFNCDEIDPSIPDPLAKNLNHCFLIVGKPGSSKTTLIMNLIAKKGKCYNRKYDRIYLFSPSLATIEDCPFDDLEGLPSSGISAAQQIVPERCAYYYDYSCRPYASTSTACSTTNTHTTAVQVLGS